jgi:hypothetical protein
MSMVGMWNFGMVEGGVRGEQVGIVMVGGRNC